MNICSFSFLHIDDEIYGFLRNINGIFSVYDYSYD